MKYERIYKTQTQLHNPAPENVNVITETSHREGISKPVCLKGGLAFKKFIKDHHKNDKMVMWLIRYS
jgi:hypothetical protein